jgi:hypothetical protein
VGSPPYVGVLLRMIDDFLYATSSRTCRQCACVMRSITRSLSVSLSARAARRFTHAMLNGFDAFGCVANRDKVQLNFELPPASSHVDDDDDDDDSVSVRRFGPGKQVRDRRRHTRRHVITQTGAVVVRPHARHVIDGVRRRSHTSRRRQRRRRAHRRAWQPPGLVVGTQGVSRAVHDCV